VQATLPEARPTRCAAESCSSQTFRRYGKPKKHVRDLSVRDVQAQRWQCTECGRTFRLYPTGVSHRQQTQRLQALSVYLWLLGISLGGVADLLLAFGCPLSRPTILGNLERAGTAARRRLRDRLRSRIVVQTVAVDCTHVTLRGREKVVIQSVDAQSGLSLEIMILPGEDERTIVRYVQRMAKLTGCQVIVTDDADVFKTAADAAGLQHQVCQQHVVPNSLTLLGDIAAQVQALPAQSHGPDGLTVEQALADVAALEEIILARSPGSQADLEDLQQRYQVAEPPRRGTKASAWYRLRLLTLDLAEDWPRLTLTDRYRRKDGKRLVPGTNNVSERGIGLDIKERYRTMRGYKSRTSLLVVPALTAYAREKQGTACLTDLLAA
jgi:hypothetical protein